MGESNGIWIWRLKNLPGNYLDQLVKCKVGRVYLKVIDGPHPDKKTPVFWKHQCNPELIERFRTAGMEVWGWGYHYGAADIGPEVAAMEAAKAAGIAGYVLDIEAEAENPATHPHFEKLMRAAKAIFPGKLGYTSFGHPGFHPKLPWKAFDEHCDFALPQIYFELFSFKPTNAEEVQECLAAHQKMGLKKPILPIWSSEPGAKRPASLSELQGYLDRYPGSSIWRAPGAGETSLAFSLDYSGKSAPAPVVESVPAGPLPPLGLLRVSSEGPDVAALQAALRGQGLLPEEPDGVFGPRTLRAVRAFQWLAGIVVDGVVGPQTWTALGGKSAISYPVPSRGLAIADIAMEECRVPKRWDSPQSEAEKYLQPMREPMRKLGHIGKAPVWFNWCASFVTWCARQAGATIPDQPDGFWATMAKCEAWKYWAIQSGYWLGKDMSRLSRGDIIVFEWRDGDAELDHIGIVAGYTPGNLTTYEGNRANATVAGSRDEKFVAGIIRLP